MIDEFLEDKPLWVVDLSNGEKIFQDDGRPGATPYQAWMRLAAYLKKNSLKIIRFYLQNRSHVEFPLPENAAAYFFCKKLLASFSGDAIIESYLVGYADSTDGPFYISEWGVPALLEISREVRGVADIKHDEYIIYNE